MSFLAPDDATIEAMAKVILGLHEGEAYMESCRDLSDGILAAIRAGKIPLPEDVPQVAALRARVVELEAQAKDVETHSIMADYKRDELRAALREIGEIVGVSLSVDAAHETHTSVVDEVRRSLCYNRGRVAELESRAKAHAEALVIVYGVGAASRNDEVRERDAAKALAADAQIYVREIIEENAENWGERLMHKQQPAIDCDAAITAFLEGK